MPGKIAVDMDMCPATQRAFEKAAAMMGVSDISDCTELLLEWFLPGIERALSARDTPPGESTGPVERVVGNVVYMRGKLLKTRGAKG